MLTDKDIQKLKGAFATADDHSNLEKKVDDIAEKVNTIDDKLSQLPTRADMEQMLERSLTFAALKVEHDRMKQIIKEKLHVEV